MQIKPLIAAVVGLSSCIDPDVSTSSRGVTVGPSCTITQAIQTAHPPYVAVGGCAAGGNIVNIPSGTYAQTARVNITSSITILGDCASWPVIDMGMRDRFMLISGPGVTLDFECLEFRNVCPGGGNCATIVGGSVPSGGAFYFNSTGTLIARNFRVVGGLAQSGCGFAICASGVMDAVPLIEDFEVTGCASLSGGGGATNTHVDAIFRRAWLHDNRARNSGRGGNVYAYGGRLTIEDSVIEGGVSENSDGGNIAVVGAGPSNANALPVIVEVIGSTIANGIANGSGANVFVQAGVGGAGVLNSYCPSGGCSSVLTDSRILGGVADSPLSWPPGDGGNLFANITSTMPGRIEIRGTTLVSGGVDPSSTSRPDCNAVEAYDLASVANPTNCTITQHAPLVCGNGVIDGSEECDDGGTVSGDGCSSLCIAETCTIQCVQTAMVCE